MNYKFNLGNVSINMPGEGKVEVKDISVEVTDFNLKDIPSIIKETRKAFKDIKESMNETIEEPVEAPKAQEEPSFKGIDEAFDKFIESMEEENPLPSFIRDAILSATPGAKIIPTPNGFAIAVPRNQ